MTDVNIIGGPEDNSAINGGAVNQATTQEVKTEEKKPIYLGNKEFNSVDELVKYTQEIQTKLVDKELVHKPLPAMETANQPKPSQLLFEDPDAFYELTVQEAERRIDSKLQKEKQESQLWNKFWTENKDLKEYEDLVQAKIAQRRADYKDLPADQGLSKIAGEVRGIISKVKGSIQGGKELPSTPAMVAGSSNGVTTAQVAVKPVSNASFVDQLRQKQKKGKR